MSLDNLLAQIGDYGKDVRINFKNVLAGENTPGLSPSQARATLLACIYATKDKALIQSFLELEQQEKKLSEEETFGARAAVAMMGMNNVYYRSIHLSENKEWSKLPAKLRMTVMANPGVSKLDFETYCLALSAMSGCGMCINSHIDELQKGGMTPEGIQSSIRIAAIVNSLSQTLAIGA
jgi:lipoyl-dependent peroxiredoxin subunit D